MNIPFIFIFIIFILYILSYYKSFEYFNVWDYEYPLSSWVYKTRCPSQGTIDELNNPVFCFDSYNIPSIYNVATYQSEINPDA